MSLTFIPGSWDIVELLVEIVKQLLIGKVVDRERMVILYSAKCIEGVFVPLDRYCRKYLCTVFSTLSLKLR